MQLQLRPAERNAWPLMAMAVRGSSAKHWIAEMECMGIAVSDHQVYPVPGMAANTLWGCLVLAQLDTRSYSMGLNSSYQLVHGQLFIPENATIYPSVTREELEQLLGGRMALLHPSCGLVELTEPVRWDELLTIPPTPRAYACTPIPPVVIPTEIRTMRLQSVKPEEVLRKMETQLFPEHKQDPHKPLSVGETLKLGFLKALLGNAESKAEKIASASGKDITSGTDQSGGKGFMDKLRQWIKPRTGAMLERMQMNLEELERRNQNSVDKLMKMLKDNPQEALKYALPLGGEGSRGPENGLYNMGKLWSSFSLFGNAASSGGGGAVNLGDRYHDLHMQYTETARNLIKEGDYEKAAFVYIKLLRNYRLGAQTLEQGKLHAEAASVYLRLVQDKQAAAQCYENGRLYEQALEQYEELGNYEKAGDMNLHLNRREAAMKNYQVVVTNYKNYNQFLKASLLSKNKMQDLSQAQELLLEGWKSNCDAFNCLNNYFDNIQDSTELKHEINRIRREDIHAGNASTFIDTMVHENKKHPELKEAIENTAYQIISKHAVEQPSLVNSLRHFHTQDKVLPRDLSRARQLLSRK